MCERYQIPRSEFLSWPDDDQDLAIAAELRRRECCPGCGVHPSEGVERLTAASVRCGLCEDIGVKQSEVDPGEHGVHVKIVTFTEAQEMRERVAG